MRQPPTPQVLYGLVNKYERMLRLRTEPSEAPPTTELRSLARQFPGSLRELDRLPLETLRARLRALEAVLSAGAPVEPWMLMQVSYHGYMRATLRIKRWSRQWPSEPAAALVLLTAKYAPAEDEPPLSFFDAGVLGLIRRPPGGRLNPLVLEAVAELHGTTPQVVSEALIASL